MSSGAKSRGGHFQVTLKANATMTTSDRYKPAYLTGAGQAGIALTLTNIPVVGTIADASGSGTNSSVLVNLFSPTQVGICGAAISAGDFIGVATGGAGFITYNTATAGRPCGIAVDGCSVSTELFEFIPFITANTST